MPTVDFRLYLVTDRRQTCGRPLVPLLHEAGEAGLPSVQIRERDLSVRAVCDLVTEVGHWRTKHRPKVLINDRVDVALSADVDGVHLRADSLPIAVVRRLLGPHKMLGVSTHSLEDVRRAEAEGADFVVLGPVYETSSKRAYGAPLGVAQFEGVARAVRIPVFAIGGVTRARIGEVRRAGAFGVAVISALLSAEKIGEETRALLRELNDANPF